MSARTVEKITKELEGARGRLAELRADRDKQTHRAEQLREQGIGLIAEGKRSEAKKVREARSEAEDEAAAAQTLSERAEKSIAMLEKELSDAVRQATRVKLEAAESHVEQVGKTLSAALEGVGRAAERHRQARAERDQLSRSLSIPVSSHDATAWTIFGSLIKSGTVHSGDITLERSALLRWIEPIEEAAARRAVQAEAKRESDSSYRLDVLRDEVKRLEARLASARRERTKAGREKAARVEKELGLVRRQVEALENPEPVRAGEEENVNA